MIEEIKAVPNLSWLPSESYEEASYGGLKCWGGADDSGVDVVRAATSGHDDTTTPMVSCSGRYQDAATSRMPPFWVILRWFWTLSYPSDGGSAALIAICHCGDVPEYLFMASDQFLANGGGLTRRTSKVTADFRFLRFYKRGISHDWRNFQ
mmetsp:Transcript_27535/g.40633  ORF Transcript_27535/g.40633 Transcript_27535/m.40633 type:complete len:151 (+) Transcript_27535:746-1198(+)